MKFLYILLLALCLSFSVNAQITAAEYFIDTDPGIGNGITLPVSGNTIDQDFSISTTGLSEGMHKMYVRVQHAGAWSLYAKNVFYVTQNLSNPSNIASAEYFFNTDPGVGNATPLAVSGSSINQNVSIATTGLSAGIHKLYVRVVNSNGTWAFYDKQIFYMNPNKTNTASIASAEYFFDTDPGVGNGEALSVSGNTISQNYSIATNNLQGGMHNLYIRTVNTDGTWSLYDKQVFSISEGFSNSALITAAEYFFDVDPGLGNASPIAISDTQNLDSNFEIDVPTDIGGGDHYLYVRVKSTDDTWSLFTREFISSTLSNEEFNFKQVKIYPNPVDEILQIEVKSLEVEYLKIINIMGQVIYQFDDDFVGSVNLGFLKSGTYLLQLKTPKGMFTKRIVKK
ncbi:T9SS type A sorting domain-containing protein [Tamlana sp. 62-3]|uniref:T9SS type A sorting domain-containing protein n=1 Tax=Neotamlana sargassicola TaxID=2883125 RepID=A0A9X1L6V9_9FLAO|nr:T9SS type A sorting domain-containing protein [Tamlana sargassicola]MCB4808176.1 T9SS type A sorting domain-containing protein [Tamlana sargassicola]